MIPIGDTQHANHSSANPNPNSIRAALLALLGDETEIVTTAKDFRKVHSGAWNELWTIAYEESIHIVLEGDRVTIRREAARATAPARPAPALQPAPAPLTPRSYAPTIEDLQKAAAQVVPRTAPLTRQDLGLAPRPAQAKPPATIDPVVLAQRMAHIRGEFDKVGVWLPGTVASELIAIQDGAEPHEIKTLEWMAKLESLQSDGAVSVKDALTRLIKKHPTVALTPPPDALPAPPAPAPAPTMQPDKSNAAEPKQTRPHEYVRGSKPMSPMMRARLAGRRE
jgi:hypothetical protein